VFVSNALEHGPMRFVELKTHIRGITPKVLTETLRALQRDGLVTRTDYEENPPRVEYELTELGRSLLEPLRAVRRWAEAHVPEIQAANAAAAATEVGGTQFTAGDRAGSRPAPSSGGRRTAAT
jgi:DNA-binding HxlR family transcriptional regulator